MSVLKGVSGGINLFRVEHFLEHTYVYMYLFSF